MAVTYELCVLQKGRWNLEAQFQSDQRQTAIDEAKELERQPHIEGAKVIREKIDDAGNSTESTIYNSDRKKTGRLSGGNRGGGARAGSFADMEVEVGGFDLAEMVVGGDDPAPAVANAPAKVKGPKVARAARRMSPQGLALYKLYKLFIVVVTSFGFAALVTWVFLQTGLIAFA